MTRISLLFAALVLFPGAILAQSYDLVILNGRVMDPETSFDGVRNVGITNGKISAITDQDLSGAVTIDASDLVVSPGFVDLHVHAHNGFSNKVLLRDGVTTALELEGGTYPVKGWYGSREGKSAFHYGASVSHQAVRAKVLDGYVREDGNLLIPTLNGDFAKNNNWQFKVSSESEVEQIVATIDEQLREGGIGVGITVGYYSGGASSPEIYEVFQTAGQHRLPVFVHGRFSGHNPAVSGYLGLLETMAAAMIADTGIVLQHFHSQTLGETRQAIKLFEDARSRGFRVLGEVYPYNFGSSFLYADYLEPDNYQNKMGREVSDIIEVQTGKALTQERYDELMESAPETNVLFYSASEDDLDYALSHPSIAIGSDAGPAFKADGNFADESTAYNEVSTHPRLAGSHARVLRLTREKDLMPLMTALSKMTFMPANFLAENGVPAMKNKGRLQVGADADITIFDPDTVTDNSTIEQGGLPSTGIVHVLVSGVQVVKNEMYLMNTFPGKPIYSEP